MRRLLLPALLVLLAGCAAGQTPDALSVELAPIFQNHAVLQRGTNVPVWGTAEPGGVVVVEIAGAKKSSVVDEEGKWKVLLPPMEAGGPHTMTVSGQETITLEDILIGEVWVCSGQSNMQWRVAQSNNAEQEIAAANHPNIRLFQVKMQTSDTPLKNPGGQWKPCTPETVPQFTAVGYYFGRELNQKLEIPVGLIQTAWGGTPSEAWTSPRTIKAVPQFAPIVERWKGILANYDNAMKEYNQRIEEWRKEEEKAKAAGKPAPRRPRPPAGPGNPHIPGVLFNGMIEPLLPYAVKGAIWYQGESNAGRAYQYRVIFPAMIQDWRMHWGQGNFPFLFVQLANFMQRKPEPAGSGWAELREAQMRTLKLPNTGMAVAIDIGEANDIHPRNKQDVGKRLAIWALAKFYGHKIVHSGPLYQSMKVEGDNIRVLFDRETVGSGLMVKGGGELKGFAIAGPDKEFVWTDAKIDGDSVVVSGKAVSKPAAVRYAWADNPECNLYNKEGLPASPFRTDEWPGVTYNQK